MSNFIIETRDLGPNLWAVFTGREGEDPHFVALFVSEEDARAYVAAKHPDPEEDGRALAFDATWTPARIPPVTLTYANDYRVHTREEFDAAVPVVPAAPVPMLLACPRCRLQHIDAPDERTPGWTNPPHRSHLCHGCGHVWRPADVPTEGVAALATKGAKDGGGLPHPPLKRGPFTEPCFSCGRDWIILATVGADHQPPSEVMAAHDCDGVGVLARAERVGHAGKVYDVRAIDTESAESTPLEMGEDGDG